MKISYSQLVQTPWGYSFHGQYKTYKARLSAENANALVKVVGNANITSVIPAKQNKLIVIITTGSNEPVWDKIRLLKPKQSAKQLLLKL